MTYPPAHHQENDKDRLIEVVKRFPLGTVITAIDNKPLITHLPVIYDDQSGRLVSHIDAANPQVASLKLGEPITVIFHGPSSYISPAVYASEQLPTWNYIIVHITGTVIPVTEAEDIKQSLIKMAAYLEGSEPGFVLQPDNPKMNRLVDYIRGFEVEITSWEGKFKLTQDKHPRERRLTKAHMLEQWHENVHDIIDKMYR